MNKQATTPAAKVSATSILENSHIKNVSIWVLLHNGEQAGKVIWTWGAGGAVKCAVICWKNELFGFDGNDDTRLNSLVIGSAGGYGYDKRQAAFLDCLQRNGYAYNDNGGATWIDPRGLLQSIGLTVIEAI